LVAEALKTNSSFKIEYVNVADTGELAKAVSKGIADAAVLDGIVTIEDMKKYANITIAMPASDSINWSCWAVKKGDVVLSGIIKKYLNYAKSTGVFDKEWEDSFGMTFVDFLKLLNL